MLPSKFADSISSEKRHLDCVAGLKTTAYSRFIDMDFRLSVCCCTGGGRGARIFYNLMMTQYSGVETCGYVCP